LFLGAAMARQFAIEFTNGAGGNGCSMWLSTVEPV